MVVFVGDDWAEDHHDVCVMDEKGARLAGGRLPEGLEGIARFHEMVAPFVDDPSEVIVGIETDRGLWVHALVAAGYHVYAINPMVVSRYRDRHSIAGAKSDPADAKVLADLVRTDRHNFRPISGDSPQAEEVKVLARAHQTLVWERTRHGNRLRSALREYYPAALEAFGGDLTGRDAVAVLARAPHPNVGARLTVPQIRAVLKQAGRQRYLDQRASQIVEGLRTDQLPAPPEITAAFSETTRATVSIIRELNDRIEDLGEVLAGRFREHPDAVIYQSVPGVGDVLGARMLGEFGDDPDRYATAKSRKNYAGTSPITRASGGSRAILARYVRNHRLYDALDQAAGCSLQKSPGCRRYYDERKNKGATEAQALRALANRLVGILHGCLRTRTTYNEDTAWAHRQPTQQPDAA